VNFAGVSHVYDYTIFRNIHITGTLIASASEIEVDGDWINDGSFIHNNGVVDFAGQTTVSGLSTTVFNNINIYGQFTGHNKQMKLEGNWVNNGFYIHNGGSVTFSGTTNQSIGIGSQSDFYNLVIDNPVWGVCLVQTCSVENELRLENGYLSIYTYTLTIQNPLTTAINRNNGYIISETDPGSAYSFLEWKTASSTGTYEFPFGTLDGQSYIPVVVNITTGGIGNGSIRIATYHTDDPNNPFPNGVTHMNDLSGNDQSGWVVNRYWITQVNGYSIKPTSSIAFNAAPGEVGQNQNLATEKWDGTNWVTVTGTPGSIPNGAMAMNTNDYTIYIIRDGGQKASDNPSGIASTEGMPLTVFPNLLSSGNSFVNIRGIQSKSAAVAMFDMNGKQIMYFVVQNENYGSVTVPVETSSRTNGMYYFKITDGSRSSVVKMEVMQ